MRCLAVCQDELVIRMLDRDPAARLRSRVHCRQQAARAPPPRRGGDRHGRRSPAHRHLPQGRPHPRNLRHHRRQPAPQPQARAGGGARCRRHARVRAWAGCRRDRQASRRATRRVSGRRVLVDVRALWRPPAHRVQPVAHTGQGPAVPALLQRRGPGAHPAAPRARSRRARQRPRAAERAPPHENDGDYRRACRA